MIAKAGEAVTDEEGNVICRVKNDLHLHQVVSVSDFHEFAEGETPWEQGQVYDRRCLRPNAIGGLQICINGEWRP